MGFQSYKLAVYCVKKCQSWSLWLDLKSQALPRQTALLGLCKFSLLLNSLPLMEGNMEILLEFPSNKFFKNAASGLLIYS